VLRKYPPQLLILTQANHFIAYDAVLKTEVETIKLLGGKFVQLQRTPNISTSEIIEKIKKQ
jgi:hypothetical protein